VLVQGVEDGGEIEPFIGVALFVQLGQDGEVRGRCAEGWRKGIEAAEVEMTVEAEVCGSVSD
jgi:hypothetical protein